MIHLLEFIIQNKRYCNRPLNAGSVRLMNTLYPDIEGDQWEDKWNKLKRNCPKMDMDGIGQIFDLTERRS